MQADQSGTVVEILAEDGKPVSIDMVFLISLLCRFLMKTVCIFLFSFTPPFSFPISCSYLSPFPAPTYNSTLKEMMDSGFIEEVH